MGSTCEDVGQEMNRWEAGNKILDNWLGKPFALADPSNGLDCINYILIYYGQLGYKFPEEFDGLTRSNYAKAWVEDKDKTTEIMGRFLLSLGTPIEKNFFMHNDLLLFEGREFPIFARIYQGGGNMTGAWREGFHPVPFRAFEKYFIAARRLI
jgi:hypothetical protein